MFIGSEESFTIYPFDLIIPQLIPQLKPFVTKYCTMLNTDVINYLENCRYWRLKYIVVNREEVSECADDWRAHLPPEILSERVPTSK